MSGFLDQNTGFLPPGPGAGTVASVSAGDGSITIGGTGTNPTVAVTLAAATPLGPGVAAVGTSVKAAKEDHVHPSGLVLMGIWYYLNIPASNSTVFASLGGAVTNGSARYIYSPNAWKAYALSMDLSNGASPDQAAAGSAIGVEFVIGGSATGSLLSISVGQSRNSANISAQAVAANTQFGVRPLTDGSWTGTTLEAMIQVWGKFDAI